MTDGILPALGRFDPHALYLPDGTTTLEQGKQVTLITNLAGTPIRFTLNESIDNIVSTGTLTLLNADISELGEIQSGVAGPILTEDDEAQWGRFYTSAPVEPNQHVWVTEVIGDFTNNMTDEFATPIYIDTVNAADSCTTYWRVIDFQAYVDENSVPYCDVSLEGYPIIAVETKIVPDEMGSKISEVLIVMDKEYWDRKVYYEQKDALEDEYAPPQSEVDLITEAGFIAVEDANTWLDPFFTLLSNSGFAYTGSISGLTYMPCKIDYQKGQSCWQAISDFLALNKIFARFKRDLSLVYWSTELVSASDEGYGETVDIGTFSTGIRVQYSKQGVYNYATVTGYIGKKDVDGYWIPDAEQPIEVPAYSSFANNILNGTVVTQAVEAPANMLAQDEVQIINFGITDMYKSCLSSRGVSYSSDSIPLSAEVGMHISGTSAIAGAITMLILTLTRTTDAEANTVETSITGRPTSIAGPGDSWLPNGASTQIGLAISNG